ncbi:MAG TPA: hypothetical protein VJJ52_07280 [Candidatus Nanoarchaeia archaeon]|nr:hypothetical protein [Candidatus Nanoarchaeia archaeon]
MAGKARGEIKVKLVAAGIPDEMIKELLPVEGAAATGAAPGTAPAAGAAAAPGAKAAPAAAAPKKEDKKK